jgi:subtilase family serine protease
MNRRRITAVGVACATLVATAWGAVGIAAASTTHAAPDRVAVRGTGVGALASHVALSAVADGSTVRVSVFVGRNQAGLSATALATAEPGNARYHSFLSPAQVAAQYGATVAQRAQVAAWLHGSGLSITHSSPFIMTAVGTAAEAQKALGTQVEQYTSQGVHRLIPAGDVTVPSALSGLVTTVVLSPRTPSATPHEQLTRPGASTSATTSATTSAAAKPSYIPLKCSAYSGQKTAKGTPKAYGKTQTWGVCGFTPAQLRGAYGVPTTTTGKGVTIGILSEDEDTTALSDANHRMKDLGEPQFKKGQFTEIVTGTPPIENGALDEDSMDIQSSHGMATSAKEIYSVADGSVTGSALLDALNQLVVAQSVDVVTSSWYEGYIGSVSQSLIDAWEGVIKQASAEGISINFATGDYADTTPLQYPGSDPALTTVGGTSLAVTKSDTLAWEAPWQNAYTSVDSTGKTWTPAPPGSFVFGGTGGISTVFKEPSWQKGVVPPGSDPNKMRAVPDVSALGDPVIGGFTYGETVAGTYEEAVNGGTSLSSPLFTAMEADAIQGSGGTDIGFANPTLYSLSGTKAMRDIVQNPLGKTQLAVVAGSLNGGEFFGSAPTLVTTAVCSDTHALTCGKGYDTVTGIGAPAKGFYTAFGS